MKPCSIGPSSRPHSALRPTLLSLALSALFTGLPAAAQTQDSAQPAAETLDTVVVTGMKSSLMKAQDRKRNADQVVDSIVADDIGKLPDANVAEALQRIAGVQISRNRGEGDRVQVRGLSQTISLLNGRSIFTAGKERGLSLQDVPSELLAGADVFKTPTADQVEGGIGGVIDLRTRRPFDFSGAKVAGTVKTTYADLSEKSNVEGSALLSNRWRLDGGEFGALLSVAHQKRNYRADTQELGTPAELADGSGVHAPTGVWYAYEAGTRARTGVSASLQFRPNKEWDFYLDANHTELKTETDMNGHFASPYWANWSAATNLGALWPVEGTISAPNKKFEKGLFYGASASTTGAITDRETKTSQLAIGADWHANDWRVKSELSYTDSSFSSVYSEVRLGTFAATQYSFDMTTELPSAFGVMTSPTDLLSKSKYWADKALYFRQENDGHETVLRLDGEKRLDGFFSRLRAGVRASDRKATSAEVNTMNNIWTDTPGSGVGGAVTALDQQIGVIPYSNLLHTAGSGQIVTQWLSLTNLNWLRDTQGSRKALGLTVPGMDLAQTFEFGEETAAVYGLADFDTTLLSKSVTGNFGLRVVKTRNERNFYNTTGAAPLAQQVSDSETDVLPSLNAHMELSDKLLARIAASKVVSRPDFNQLTPSLSLNVNDKTGYLGNPYLGALSANQFDASLEYYMSKSDHVYGAAFYKKVDGFIQTSTQQLVYQGETYTVSTPKNGENGTIQGIELGYQAFFTGLPGALRGLGLQANYTYVDSSAPGPLGGQKTQLQNLSRDSYNLIAMYDYSDFALRLAYNYRGKALVDTMNYYPNKGSTIAQTSVYMKAYGMLDAYASYQINKNLKLSVEANNLLRTKRTSYYAVDNLPRGTYADDRRFGLSLMAEM